MLFRQSGSFHAHESSGKKCVTVYANGDFLNGKRKFTFEIILFLLLVMILIRYHMYVMYSCIYRT